MFATIAKTNAGNATDIGTTYVRYLENRRPKHQGVRGFEAERHSLSYVFDVCTFEMKFFMTSAHKNVDVTTRCTEKSSSRLDSRPTSPFIAQQGEAPGQRGKVDAGRTAPPHW
jgi:hypothetical protein